MVECAEEAERKGVNQQGEQAVDRACCTRQISQLIHEWRRKHRHEAGCDDKERRGGVEELGDTRNDTAGLFAKHPQRRRPLPVGVGEVGGHLAFACVRVPRGWPMSERERGGITRNVLARARAFIGAARSLWHGFALFLYMLSISGLRMGFWY